MAKHRADGTGKDGQLENRSLGNLLRLKATGKGEQSRTGEGSVEDCPSSDPHGVVGKHLGKSGR